MGKKLSTENFIEQAKLVHGDKYDYSLVEYINSNSKIKIICPEHGSFHQRPPNHVRGQACPKCGNINSQKKQKITLNEFSIKSKLVHGSRFDYSLVNYINNSTNIKIICPEHGVFNQTPAAHFKGGGCRLCFLKKNKEKFLEKIKIVHGDKYNYSLMEYTNWDSDVKIICPEHGIFHQMASNHSQGKGCPKCSQLTIGRTLSNINEFKNKAIKKHGDKYDYTNSVYLTHNTPITIYCKKHKLNFTQTPDLHLRSNGCKLCCREIGQDKLSLSHEKFLEKSYKNFNGKYEYLNKYIIGNTIMKIKCPEHGIFHQKASEHGRGHGCKKCSGKEKSHIEWLNQANKVHSNKYIYLNQYEFSEGYIEIKCPNILHNVFRQKANNHLQGQGCPECGLKKNKSEIKLKNYLKMLFSDIQYQYRCDWLKTNKMGNLSLDLFLLNYNIGIEYQGIQHFKEVKYFGGEKTFLGIQERDERKRLLCEANGCKLFYFTYKPKDVPADYPHKIYSDEQELKEAIGDYIETLNK